MRQAECRIFLIRVLLQENRQYRNLQIPVDEAEQKKLLRSFDVRPPHSIGKKFLTVQDEYLQEETARKGITDIIGLTPAEPGIYLWHGDITTLNTVQL